MLSTYSKILPKEFYIRPTVDVARDLLGKLFVRKLGDAHFIGKIVEVEAYHQLDDEASHSYNGQTRRNEMMFEEGGCLYVYFTYGMHYCMNIVTEAKGVGAAVLIRGIEPIEGIETMRELRGKKVKRFELTNGPAKCCQAFAIGKAENGISLTGPILMVFDAPSIPENLVDRTRRIGITRSRELEWRFAIKENPFVSRISTGKNF